MEKINDIIVMRLIYMSYAAFNLGTYQHKDSRIQDEYTKVAIEVGKKVVKNLEILPEPSRRGLVFTTSTGPISSVKEFEPMRCSVIQILDDLCDMVLLLDNRDNKFCFGTLIMRDFMINKKYKRFGIDCVNVLKSGRNYLCV